MKIIFLDIDGVLNSSEYRKRMGRKYYTEIIDRSKMPLLKRIVDATDSTIILIPSIFVKPLITCPLHSCDIIFDYSIHFSYR